MEKTLRIICLWICFRSCLLGYADVEVQAVPLEYFDNHDQLSYDMDTEQSKVKYDPRILSEQDDNDVWAHERAASCSSGTTKYTHGQKIPRDDPCEVCLCVDGEIFCWWKHCDVSPINSKLAIQSNKVKNQKFFESTQKTALNITTTTTTSTITTSSPLNKKEFFKKQYPITRISKKMHKVYSGYHQQNQQQQQQKQKKTKHNLPSNKILNFPENLPSVLYYDYKTEEHQHHQHQHQHLKHHYPLKELKKHEYSDDSHRPGVAGGGGGSSRSSNSKRQQKEHNIGNMLPCGELSVNRTIPGDNSNIDTPAQLLLLNGASSTYASNTVEGDNEDDDGDDIRNRNGDQRGNRIRSHSDKLKSLKTNNGKISLQSTLSTSSSLPPFSIDDIKIRNSRLKENVLSERFLIDKNLVEYPNNANINGGDKKLLTRRPVAFADDENSLNPMDMLKDTNMDIVNGDNGNQIISANNHYHRGTGVDVVDGKVAAVAALFRSTLNDFSSEFNASSSKLNLILSESERQSKGQQQQLRHEPQQVEPIILEANSILDYRANISNNTSTRTNSNSNNSSHREADFTNLTTISALRRTTGGTYINNASAQLVEITTTTATAAPETPPTSTDNTKKECIVMDTSYKIGDILPQETGNCLQCICIDGTMKDDTPRVTCSPHNCPPLILPDLLDATGY